jgi:hemerythrin-like domain-containing protein
LAGSDELALDVVFFDVRDTLGEVDRPGHLVPYRPSTEKLLVAMREVGLRIGIITNLPDEVSAEEGRQMLQEAILSENPEAMERFAISDFLDPKGIITNHEAGVSKPNPEIYLYAARQLGVPVERCMYSSENLIEILGAKAAGMQTQLKPSPPGREFLPAVVTRLDATERDSGRAFEAFLEHEHLLGDRIFDCGAKIVEGLRGVGSNGKIPDNVRTAMGLMIYLTNNFADQAHFAAEEAVIPLAIARGMDPEKGEWVYRHHDQARAYWRAMDVAWSRIEAADPTDMPYAIADFRQTMDSFVTLFRHHAIRENDELYPGMGKYFSDTDDTLIINLISRIGPPDFTPYVGIVSAMEMALGIAPAG